MNHLTHLAKAERAEYLRRQRTTLPQRVGPVRPFLAESGPPPLLIAEFKRSSPSHGAFPGVALEPSIRRYERLGASAISILVAQEGFSGSLEDLRVARSVTSLPLLYKGFVTEVGQIEEAYAYGADAVLLIAALLGAEIGRFRRHAAEMGMQALCEVHDAAELDMALGGGADLIGINNRDLRSLETDTGRFIALARRAPQGATLVAESGYRTAEAVREAAQAGARAVLIGEALLAKSPLGALWGEVSGHVG